MANKHFWSRIARKTHKWMGLVLFLQLLFWIGGGLIMSALPLHMVHGKHLHRATEASIPASSEYGVSIDTVMNSQAQPVESIAFYRIGDVPVFELRGDNTVILSGIDGLPMPELGSDDLVAMAQQRYTGDAAVLSTERLERAPAEASRVRGPAWQVVFDDWIATTFYMHPVNGQLLSVRSDLWRLFDFVWMLHIMDYDEREDFNNPLLIGFAASALLFCISGIVLLWQSLSRSRQQSRRRAQGSHLANDY